MGLFYQDRYLICSRMNYCQIVAVYGQNQTKQDIFDFCYENQS